MHYLVFVFVDEPTKDAVAKAMDDHKEAHWDWYRYGGRWDGFLLGEEEMKRRETDDGFNFADKNDDVSRNCCKVSGLPKDKKPHFFVADYHFIPKRYFNEFEKSPHYDGYGAVLETPYWQERYDAALEKHKDGWVVVVDAHN